MQDNGYTALRAGTKLASIGRVVPSRDRDPTGSRSVDSKPRWTEQARKQEGPPSARQTGSRFLFENDIIPWGGGMATLLGVPVEVGSNSVLVVEVDASEIPDDLVLASAEPGKVVDRARVTLEEALERLKPSLHKIIDLLKDLAPDETEVEFGLKVGGETGVIVAKGTAEVNFVIRMSWKSE